MSEYVDFEIRLPEAAVKRIAWVAESAGVTVDQAASVMTVMALLRDGVIAPPKERG